MTEGQSQIICELLGIQMTSVDNGKLLKMTKDGLIENIINTCGMEDFKLRQTPTDVVAPLSTDSLGKKVKLQY